MGWFPSIPGGIWLGGANMVQHGYFGTVRWAIWTWFFLLGSDQDCQHNNLKLICGMIQLKLLRTVKKKDVSFPEVWLQRRAAHRRAWNQTTLLEWHVSTNLHPVTLFMPSILPKGYLYFEKPQFWLRISKTIKDVSIHFIQCSLKLGWYHVVHHQINGCPKGAPLLVPSPRDPPQPRDAPGRSSSGYTARLQWRIHRSRMRTVWTWQRWPGKASGWQIDQKWG